MYADYDYYITSYNAENKAIIPEEMCMSMLRRASALLGNFFALNKPQEPYIDVIKIACCEIADMIYIQSKHDGISSENIDGYNVNYDDSKSITEKAYEIATMYLSNTGYLYRGM